jgi:hypothetical protein
MQGKYTYREDLSPEQMAAVVMENYDGNFHSFVKGVYFMPVE